ncbi:nuclear matrix constituent protein 1-like protein-like [Dorcoceras hygrometricum]|uniref:Nuclear matrix constituent protein 1-like protein-like n=1 Tax=Dorcoceras hygrometricum TaxID=472368 RepID=A0A2Z7CS28_9LAMI|nr:nuclear matrix constituent protein 1-like protein-like [Dorcoceras hygrometricum]
MRSVVASHGPGSNPRGNAICNAILLQCFPVLQIFGLQYLDRHCPSSSDVLPLNLAQKLKISKSIKTGPTSHTGPKTSRAARDRPESNPRRIQTSRHNIAGDSPERRPAGGATTTKIAAAACGAARNSAPQRRVSLDSARPGDASKQRQRACSQRAHTAASSRDERRTTSVAKPSATSRSQQPSRKQLAHGASPAMEDRTDGVAHTSHCPSLLRASKHETAAIIGQLSAAKTRQACYDRAHMCARKGEGRRRERRRRGGMRNSDLRF